MFGHTLLRCPFLLEFTAKQPVKETATAITAYAIYHPATNILVPFNTLENGYAMGTDMKLLANTEQNPKTHEATMLRTLARKVFPIDNKHNTDKRRDLKLIAMHAIIFPQSFSHMSYPPSNCTSNPTLPLPAPL